MVEGGGQLAGSVPIAGAKNSALKLMAASLLARGVTTLTNVPHISDVFTMQEVLNHLGAMTSFEAGTLTIDTTRDLKTEAPYELVRRMRASINVLGPLLSREGHARVAMPGGCNIGTRPTDMHQKGLVELGAKMTFTAATSKGGRIVFMAPRSSWTFLVGARRRTCSPPRRLPMASR